MKKLPAVVICLAAAAALVCGCAPEKFTYSFEAMDTFMKADIYGGKNAEPYEAQIKELDGLFSTTNTEGGENHIYRLNRSGYTEAGRDDSSLMRQALALCDSTGGALDVTVYPVVEEWGFISKDYKIPPQERLDALLERVGYGQVALNGGSISVPEGVSVDLGAVAKGYAADVTVRSLISDGASAAICNLGGTVLAYGRKPGGEKWKVGIADPGNPAGYMGYISCADRIIATSGSYERYFEGEDGKVYSHIIDPKTGYPADNGILSVTVISKRGVVSDGLSTALFVMGMERAEGYYRSHSGRNSEWTADPDVYDSADVTREGFDFIILTGDKKAYVTEGAAGDFKVADGFDYQVVTVAK